jgi:dephospho-CoA kinase
MHNTLTVIGLTGGIASGKSQVASIFRQSGIPVLDADSLGHMVLEPGQPAYEEVVSTFGTDILALDKKNIDRQKLGKKIFGDDKKRALLEAVTHPEIAKLASKGLSLIADKGEKFAVYEAALLVEAQIYKHLEALIVVSCSVENQLQRLCARDALSKTDAATRIASQIPLADKLEVADFVIENNETLEHLFKKSVQLAETLKKQYGRL